MLSKIDKASLLILPATGIIYAAGFLVVLTFLETYGIYDSNVEFWKGKYIHLGVLCLSIPVVLNSTIYPLWFIRREVKSKGNRDIPLSRLIPIMVLLANLQIMAFLLVMLARPGSSGGFYPLMLLSAIVLIGIPLTYVLNKFLLFAREKAPSFFRYSETFPNACTISLRWMFVAFAIVLDAILSNNYMLIFTEIWNEHFKIIFMFICFTALLGFIPALVTYFIDRYEKSGMEYSQRALRVMGFSILAPILYFIVLGFAYGVMPYIPATRGGGDFTVSPRAVLYFKDSSVPRGLSKILSKEKQTKSTLPLIIISDSSSVIFVADPKDAGGPVEWRKKLRNRPTVYAIQKDLLSHIEITK